MAIDTRYDTCAVCAADEQCAVVAGNPVCGDCCKEHAATVVELDEELDDLRAEVKSLEEDRDEEKMRADEAERKLQEIAATADQPKAPKKPRKANAATVTP